MGTIGTKKWLPTPKWWASLTGAVASIAASWIVTGTFDDVERGMAATALVALAAAYWKRDEPEPQAAVLESSRGSRADRSR